MLSNGTGESGRRKFLKRVGAAGTAGLASSAGCVGGLSGGGTPTINMLIWEHYQKLKDDLEEKYDAEVKMTNTTSSAKVFSSWNAGKDEVYDVAVVNNNYVLKMAKAGLLDPVPMDIYSTWDQLYPEFQDLSKQSFQYEGDMYAMPPRFGMYGYGYDSRKIPEDHEASWSVLFKDEYKGTKLQNKVIMYDNHYKTIGATALHLGMNPFEGEKAKLTADQLDEIKKTLIKQKKDIAGYIAADTTYIKSFKKGDFVVGHSGRNEIVNLRRGGYPEGADPTPYARFAKPKEGVMTWFEGTVVSKKSENKELAWKMANDFQSPELGAQLAKVGGAPSCNPKVAGKLTEKERKLFGKLELSDIDRMVPFMLVENEDAWVKAWEDVKAA